MERYEHGGDIYAHPHVQLDFSVNTHPLGMPEVVREALIARVAEFAKYPDTECRALCAAISAQESIPEEWVVCGNGAADLIYRLCYAIKPKQALLCAPTFSEYERALTQVGCTVDFHFLREEEQFALTRRTCEQLTPDIDMLFLCHPNNPTGRLIPKEVMKSILHRAHENRTTVVVDECFLGFTEGASAKEYLRDMPSLVVLKAFTKLYGMAGLRLGYLLASDEALLQSVRACGQCWSVSAPAQVAGLAALGCTDWQAEARSLTFAEWRFLAEGMQQLGITVYQSDANFLLLRSEQPLYEPLLRKGILIRRCENFPSLDETYYRIGVKTRAENTCLLQAMKELYHG